MYNLPTLILAMLVTAAIGLVAGTAGTRETIATECEKIGAFYTGGKVYTCNLKETK